MIGQTIDKTCLTEVKVDMVAGGNWTWQGHAPPSEILQQSFARETKHLNLTLINYLSTAMARRRDKPVGGHVTPPRKLKKFALDPHGLVTPVKTRP
jgi:hypothetical protein